MQRSKVGPKEFGTLYATGRLPRQYGRCTDLQCRRLAWPAQARRLHHNFCEPGDHRMRGEPKEFRRRLPVGAEFLSDGSVHFRVWAPKRKRVEVVLPRDDLNEHDISF